MKNFEQLSKDYGTVKTDDEIIIALSQDAYPAGGSFNTKSGTYSGNWYEASGIDEDGNEYAVIWTTVDWDEEDSADACDWENPDYIIYI